MILHLLPWSEWQEAADEDLYLPSAFAEDGFVHCSGSDEVLLAVANRYYQESAEDLVVWELDELELAAEVRWEAADPAPPVGLPAGTLFPHVYGPLERRAVVGVRRLLRDEGGAFVGYDPID